MTYRSVHWTAAIFLVTTMMLTGCVGISKPSKFYLLLTIPDIEGTTHSTADSDSPSVMVGPITLAAYLDRDQIVNRTAGNELTIDEFTRWGEPLQDNFYRVLIDNLSLLLNTPKIYVFSRQEAAPPDFQVVINVMRFDSAVNGDAHMTALWSVLGEDGRSVVLNKKSIFRVTPASGDVAGVVEAQNRALTDFSSEIAAAIRSLSS